MNAREAFEITKEAWVENEQDFLPYLSGYQTKIENAAKEGKTSCTAAIVPSNNYTAFVFCANFFEQQGYYVSSHQVGPDEVSLIVDWKNEPFMSRSWKDSKDLMKKLS